MNMKLIERVIASYNATLDENDQARLAFFRGLWETMDVWSGGPVAAGAKYECPESDRIAEAWHGDEAVFSFAPVQLNKDRLVAICDALRRYWVSSDVLPEEGAQALESVVFSQVLDDDILGQLAKQPEAALDEIAQRIVAAGCEEGIARMGAMLVMLALRVEFEPVAARIAENFPKGDDIHHHPLQCPVCGGAPAIAKVGGESPTDGRGRSLYCQQCGTEWDFERVRCARCGTRNQQHLHYFNIEGDDGHRIATCDECGSYIRTVFLEEALMPFSYEVEEVVMARLDAIAHDPRFHKAVEESSADAS